LSKNHLFFFAGNLPFFVLKEESKEAEIGLDLVKISIKTFRKTEKKLSDSETLSQEFVPREKDLKSLDLLNLS